MQCARFSPDGSRLMTASDDKTIKARSLRTWPHFLVLSPKQGGLRITQNRLPDEQDVAELIVLSSILTEPRTAKQVAAVLICRLCAGLDVPGAGLPVHAVRAHQLGALRGLAPLGLPGRLLQRRPHSENVVRGVFSLT